MQIGEYEIKDDLKYDSNNNWIKVEGDTATFGISDVGVKKAKDIAFIELPAQGTRVEANKNCGQIESAKWAGELKAPVSGEIIEVNSGLADDPAGINIDPYGAWIAKIRMDNPEEANSLMDAEGYGGFVNSKN
jgi:glycine cleavage system H protein